MKKIIICSLAFCTAFLNLVNAQESDKNEKNRTIILEKNYYLSLTWNGLRKLGYMVEPVHPMFQSWSEKIFQAGKDIGFSPRTTGSPLIPFIYQIPGYFNPKDTNEFKEIMKGCKEMIKTGSIDYFLKKWPAQTAFWDQWYNPAELARIFGEIGDRKEACLQTLDIWTKFITVFWQQYEQNYEVKIKDYPFEENQAKIDSIEVIQGWNKILHSKYPYASLHVEICPENKTSAISLGPEKILFYRQNSYDDLVNTIVQETGVRYFFAQVAKDREIADIAKNDHEGLKKLIQAEVCFRKPAIYKPANDTYISGMKLETIIEWRKTQQFSGGPLSAFLKELYARAKKDGVI